MKLKIIITILIVAIGSMSFAASPNAKPSKASILQTQWTQALHDKSICIKSAQLHKVGVLFTIDENNKVEVLNLTGTNEESYELVKQQLNGLDNISELTPNEVYRIDISFQVI